MAYLRLGWILKRRSIRFITYHEIIPWSNQILIINYKGGIEMIYNFNSKQIPSLSQVGGKAKALMETTQAGFPVPGGMALSVDFFKSWLEEVKGSQAFKVAMKETTKEKCDEVKAQAESMAFTADQKKTFDIALSELKGQVFAVRSSSPEEDLEGTSFAGMYETYLGTQRKDLEKIVAKAFSSCFDFRVMEYKKRNGLDLKGTSIAIVVQKQIASDVSGVGFSLNPLNNCYDEVVINASFGLGEAIVSGIVTPDMYTYDAVQEKIIEKKINKKEIGLWLKNDGGIQEKENKNKEEQALSDKDIKALSMLIKKCEDYYGKPMDTEWALEEGKLYLLQSRPITTHIPFFEELMTKPGEKKNYYLDMMVMTQGFQEPFSVLGIEMWSDMVKDMKYDLLSNNPKGTAPALYGRHYINLSAMYKIIGKQTNKFTESYDKNVKKIFEDIDLAASCQDEMPIGSEQFKKKTFKAVMGMMPGVFKAMMVDHNKVIADYEKLAQETIDDIKKFTSKDDFNKIKEAVVNAMAVIMTSAPVMITGMMSNAAIKKMFKGDDVENEIVSLSMDLHGNPTSAMGHLLFEMASSSDFRKTASKEEFIRKTKERSYSPSFMKQYDEFMKKYSVRGMKEIDVASMRVHEDIGILYEKISEINPDDSQITSVQEKRKEAYEKLRHLAKSKGKEKKFIKAAEKFQGTFGYREHPKYVLVYILSHVHDVCLDIAKAWVKKGRLEEAYQIFDLTSEEIARGQRNPKFDLMKAREKNLEGYKKVAHVTEWPLVIDSRGKTYKPKLEIKDGDIVGDPIAPGKVVGKAKVLRSPYEKPLEPGEILIARATEPSWTPIFINAAGVVMEIGGPLQHGGIIAREYGIPCVSGLIGIMDMIKDGDLIEVDGNNGVVKILESSQQ